ncbi:MAG TPA: amidohydrolase [Tissierellaceae bacterium]
MIHIKNGNLYTMANGILEGYDILINNGKIEKIGKNLSSEGAKIIDATDRFVTPGFIDAHSHIGLSENGIGAEGNDHNEAVDPITPHVRAIDGLNPMDLTLKEAYQAGVTTAVPCPGSANVIGGLCSAIKLYGDRVDNMIIKENVAMKVAFGENPKRFYGSKNKAPATRMGVAGILRDTLFKAEEYLAKKEAANGDITKMPSFDMKLESLIPVLKKEMPIKVHAHRTDDIFTALRIAKEFDLDMTLDHCTEGHLIADELKKEERFAIVGPSFGHRGKVEIKEKSFKTAKVLNDAGIFIALTTDSPVIPLFALPMCAGLAMRAGLDEETAFKAITINPAKIIGIDDRVGSLEEGKDADIVISKGHPLTDLTSVVEYTIIDGNIVFESNN